MITAKENYVTRLIENDYIDPELYGKFDVKRGLRNADGTGVLVGLTRVGDVHGYDIIEGKKVAVPGKLFYRGIDVNSIINTAEKEKRFAYEESTYLLMFGHLPNREQLKEFASLIGSLRGLPRNFAEDSILKFPSRDIMNKLARSVLTLYSYDESPEDQAPENVLRQCLELIARFPTIVAYSYMAKKHYFDHDSLVIHVPDPHASTAELVLKLIRQDMQFSTLEAEILDMALVLHAEHGGGNNSTFAVHLISSAETDTYSAIAAGVGSLKGYKHGGANIKVMEMMDDIKKHVKRWDDKKELAAYLRAILKGEANDGSGLVYGQGHAVYTVSDPRTILLRDKAAFLAEEKNLSQEFILYRNIEEIFPEIFKKEKGIDKDICTNVDFYSGFVYKMLGIPLEVYTSIFAISRVAGWCAHRMEELISGGRIIRPAYKCVQDPVPYSSVNER
ncbi:MAG: citrate/2-methylcitrate synthase [Treponema sp.]|nr:citrate/2-methylcitrate synthase [Treponema sp.]